MYDYINQFNVTNELKQTIEAIISEEENKDYVCKIIPVIIPRHVISDSEANKLQYLNGPHEYYEDTRTKIIPKKNYQYIAIMEREKYDCFRSFSFTDKDQAELFLENLSEVFMIYDGILDARLLYARFPYLKSFFEYLDKRRIETGKL